MALVFTEYTLGTATKDGIDIGTDEIILADYLSEFDAQHLEAALAVADEEGKTLADYTMPNGKTADVYFAAFVRSEAELIAQYQVYQAKIGGSGQVAANTAAIAGLDARVTILEP